MNVVPFAVAVGDHWNVNPKLFRVAVDDREFPHPWKPFAAPKLKTARGVDVGGPRLLNLLVGIRVSAGNLGRTSGAGLHAPPQLADPDVAKLLVVESLDAPRFIQAAEHQQDVLLLLGVVRVTHSHDLGRNPLQKPGVSLTFLELPLVDRVLCDQTFAAT